MDPQELLTELCRRHGVPVERASRLLPLVRWAVEAPEEVRDRILLVVEETLLLHAQENPEQGEGAAEDVEPPGAVQAGAPGRSILVAVARVLHDWQPSDTILGLEGGEAEGPPGPTP